MYKKYIAVEGDAFSRGKQIGEELKMQIETNYLNQKRYYMDREGFDYGKWEEVAARYVRHMEKWTSEVLDEMRGMAEGAQMDFKQVLALATAYEKSFARDQISDKCTAFLVTGEASRDRKTIIGQTNDECFTEWLYQLDTVIHHIEGDREVLLYTHPGVPAYMGINNGGVAVMWTYIDNGVTGDGLPTNVIIRHLLNCRTAKEAVQFLKEAPHDIPNQFGIADKTGYIASVECFPNKVYIKTDDKYLVHANHTVIGIEEPEFTCSKTTWDRYEVMEEQVKQNLGKIDVDMCKDFLRNHDRFPNSICSHPYPEKPWNKTLAAMVFDLGQMEMHIAFGNPCDHEYRTYRFRA